VGAMRANGFSQQANGYRQTSDDHPSSQTDPYDAERPDRCLRIRRLGVRVPPSAHLRARAPSLAPGKSLRSYAWP